MAKDKDELSTFKIGDLRKPEVRGSKGPAKAAAPESPSVGFPSIEARVERGSVEDVADELRGSYERLEALAEGGDLKIKAAAKKAMGAYERTADLFEYLFDTKATLERGG